MCSNHTKVSLGFNDEMIPVGAHICQIFTDDEERSESLYKFLLSGLQTGERTTCFSDKVDGRDFRDFLATHDASYDECEENKSLSLFGTREVYFQDDVFDPDRMLDTLSTYHEESLDLGFPAARAIGEMNPIVQNIEGGNRLLEYEAKVSLLLREHPVTTVCQYDATSFDGATIMDILRVHPQMVVRGSVVHNPFFIPPEEFLKNL
ncbi:MAG: hypothetical protein HOE48_11650 [Candidatus Latescibacteria bacterium]|jgi:hypothetical protein|nr:hypothetical protein [Candidatus Latescibacterota bacterium]